MGRKVLENGRFSVARTRYALVSQKRPSRRRTQRRPPKWTSNHPRRRPRKTVPGDVVALTFPAVMLAGVVLWCVAYPADRAWLIWAIVGSALPPGIGVAA